MKNSKPNFLQSIMFPLLALLLASGIGVALSVVRLARTHNEHYALLPGNLFLAWLPLVFALAVYHLHRRGERRSVRLGALAVLWLLFFPNAPYIFTDLVHMWTWFRMAFWVDLSLVLLVAMTGFVAGYVSLYLMHSVVVERFGRWAAWAFTLVAIWLCGFGVYLGRFVRLNSWDALTHPLATTRFLGNMAAHPFDNRESLVFSTLFAIFLFLGYLMLYALTHLQSAPRAQMQEVQMMQSAG